MKKQKYILTQEGKQFLSNVKINLTMVAMSINVSYPTLTAKELGQKTIDRLKQTYKNFQENIHYIKL